MASYRDGLLGRISMARRLTFWNLAALVCAASVFLWIADEVHEREHQDFENRIMAALRTGEPPQPIGPRWLASAARDITGMGSIAVLTTMVGLVAGYLMLSRRPAAAAILLAASISGVVLNSGLKSLYGRDRPNELLRLVDTDSLSFPSGHAMSSATVYLVMAVLLCRLTSAPRQKFYLIGAALLVSFLVGLSRVYLGAHYPTDVVAGWAAGVIWAQVCWFTVEFTSACRREYPAEERHEEHS